MFRNCVNNTPKASYYPERSNIQLPSARPCHYGQFCWWKNSFCPFQHPSSITSYSRGSIVAPNTRQPQAQLPYHSLSQSTILTHNYWSPLQHTSRRYTPSRDPDPAALGEWPVKQGKAADGSTHPSQHSNNNQYPPQYPPANCWHRDALRPRNLLWNTPNTPYLWCDAAWHTG